MKELSNLGETPSTAPLPNFAPPARNLTGAFGARWGGVQKWGNLGQFSKKGRNKTSM